MHRNSVLYAPGTARILRSIAHKRRKKRSENTFFVCRCVLYVGAAQRWVGGWVGTDGLCRVHVWTPAHKGKSRHCILSLKDYPFETIILPPGRLPPGRRGVLKSLHGSSTR